MDGDPAITGDHDTHFIRVARNGMTAQVEGDTRCVDREGGTGARRAGQVRGQGGIHDDVDRRRRLPGEPRPESSGQDQGKHQQIPSKIVPDVHVSNASEVIEL